MKKPWVQPHVLDKILINSDKHLAGDYIQLTRAVETAAPKRFAI